MHGELQKTFEFIIELEKLKAVLRKTKPIGLTRAENSAEHSWHVSMVALAVASYAKEPVDIGAVIEMLLVHDIPEIDAGDHIIYGGRNEALALAEREAAARIFGMVPGPLSERLLGRWLEFEARDTKEAIFAYAVDRLIPVLQNLHNDGQSWRENGITVDQVIAVNSAIGLACPDVWDAVHQMLREAEVGGVFRRVGCEVGLTMKPPARRSGPTTGLR